VVGYSVASDCEMHDSISHRLMQCHANGCVHVARLRLRTVSVRNIFFQYSENCLKCYTVT